MNIQIKRQEIRIRKFRISNEGHSRIARRGIDINPHSAAARKAEEKYFKLPGDSCSRLDLVTFVALALPGNH